MALKKIGALWITTSKASGKQYLSGTIEGIGKVMVFKVDPAKKKTEKSPDYTVNIDDGDAAPRPPQNDAGPIPSDDDIPF